MGLRGENPQSGSGSGQDTDNKWLFVILAIVLSLLLISLSNIAVAKADTHPRLETTAIQQCMACLWQHTGNGHVKVEAAAWLLKNGDQYSCRYWPQKTGFGDPLPAGTIASITWRGVIPQNTIALIHTHPVGGDRYPSGTDEEVAIRKQMPNIVVSQHGVVGAFPYKEVNKKGKVKDKINTQILYDSGDLQAWTETLNDKNCPAEMPKSMMWNPWTIEGDNR